MSNNEQLFAEIIPSEEATLSGGMGRGRRRPIKHRRGHNKADAKALADAVGYDTKTFTFTDANVIQGVSSSSTSISSASTY